MVGSHYVANSGVINIAVNIFCMVYDIHICSSKHKPLSVSLSLNYVNMFCLQNHTNFCFYSIQYNSEGK